MMHATQLLTLLTTAATLTLGAPTAAPIQIAPDDVILYNKAGRYQIVKRADLGDLEALRQNNTIPPKPILLSDNLYLGPSNSSSSPPPAASSPAPATRLTRRGDNNDPVKLIIPAPSNRFLGWDVQMSQVVKGAPTTLSISSGYSLANTIGVTSSATFNLVKDFLSASLSISYQETWTTSETQQFSAEVPVGKYGAFVSNPWTNRNSGSVFEGRIGEVGSVSTYQADSFDSKDFGGMQWVDGVISLCTGDVFPLPRCLGEGTL